MPAADGEAVTIEFTAPPSSDGEEARPHLSGERQTDQAGSDVPALDPWAEAFAESARLAALPRITGPTYPVDPDHDQVRFFLDRFTGSRREIVGLWLSRSARYLGMIRETLRHKGLPEDLAFTAMIESGFNPVAVSRAGAKGLWQFMAGTARRYGLRVDQWVDERLDAEKSTVAAASYLRDLYEQFGSWHLAQAAYNAGELTVSRAIRATGSNDFWMLAQSRFLQRETKEFVPQIQAATVIGRDPARYGFDSTEAADHGFDSVAVPPSTDLRRLSAAAGISADTLRSLNPVLVRGITPPGGAYELRVPVGTRTTVIAILAETERARKLVAHRAVSRRARPAVAAQSHVRRAAGTGDTHIVRPNDTVSSIAKQYGVSVGDVLRWNRLDRQDRIRPGDRLRVVDVRPSVERDGQGGFR